MLALVAGCSVNADETTAENVTGPALDQRPAIEPVVEAVEVPPAAPAWKPRAEDQVAPHRPIENVAALAPFYERLARVDDGEETVVRVVNVGSSTIGADDLTGILREKFQTRFGDGGAGLVLLARYMKNYLHQWVELEAKGWEDCYIAYECMPDGHYGLGGATFWATKDAETIIRTRHHELGDEVSRFELWYLARPGGGKVELLIDGKDRHLIETRASSLEDRYYAIDVPPGPHRIRVRPVGTGPVRAYGVALETDGPGVIWDQFSMLGVFTKKMLEWDAEHIKGQIAHRDPDLLVFTYGGNDVRRVAIGKLSFEQHVQETVDVLGLLRAGKPGVACLVTGISDRSKSLKVDIEPEHVKLIVDAQREAAQRVGCAFFDTYAAMGGGGSLLEWMRRDPPLAAKDRKHLNHRGRVLMGGWIYDALIAGYVAHRQGKTPAPD